MDLFTYALIEPRPEAFALHPSAVFIVDDEQLERLSQAFVSLELPEDEAEENRFEACFPVQELGYLNKPFRRIMLPTRPGMPSDAFAGADVLALQGLLEASVAEPGSCVIFADEVERLEALEAHCPSPQAWQKHVKEPLEQLRSQGRVGVVVLDW